MALNVYVNANSNIPWICIAANSHMLFLSESAEEQNRLWGTPWGSRPAWAGVAKLDRPDRPNSIKLVFSCLVLDAEYKYSTL